MIITRVVPAPVSRSRVVAAQRPLTATLPTPGPSGSPESCDRLDWWRTLWAVRRHGRRRRSYARIDGGAQRPPAASLAQVRHDGWSGCRRRLCPSIVEGLEGLQVIGRVRPLSLIHGSQALLPQGLGGFSSRDPRHAGAASASHCRGALRGRRRVQAVDASDDERWRRGDHQMHRAGRPGCESPLRPARKPLGVTATAPR